MEKNKAYKLARALESGKYKQGKSVLRNEKNEFCCLGVACDIAKAKWSKGPITLNFKNLYQTDGHHSVIPETLLEATGFGGKGGELNKPIKVRRANGELRIYHSLWMMNDEGLSFKFIAKILRKHYGNIK